MCSRNFKYRDGYVETAYRGDQEKCFIRLTESEKCSRRTDKGKMKGHGKDGKSKGEKGWKNGDSSFSSAWGQNNWRDERENVSSWGEKIGGLERDTAPISCKTVCLPKINIRIHPSSQKQV